MRHFLKDEGLATDENHADNLASVEREVNAAADDALAAETPHPATASLKSLASAIKARWSCEQAHQQLKEELGLDHFEGRTWRGLHHHALMTLICFSFLQQERLRENKPAA